MAQNAYATLGLGETTQAHPYMFAQMGAGILQILPLGKNHAWAGRLRGDISVGDTPLQNQLSLGGRYLARGYEFDNLYGLQRLLLTFEDRHVLHGQSRNNLAGLALLTRLEGALFADISYLGQITPTCEQSVFYDVGYGIRFLFDAFNMVPATLQLDIGIPLNRTASDTFTGPVVIYLAFVQSLWSF